jgi:hypothetical protein
MSNGNADFAKLGDAEFTSLGDIFQWCELGRVTASNAGLIVVQGAYDVRAALMTIGSLNGSNAKRRANRAARHLAQCADLLHGVQARMAKTPKVIVDEYQEEIQAARRGQKKPLRLDA